MKKRMSFLFLVLFITIVGGCVVPYPGRQADSPPAPGAIQEYMEIEFGRFASGAFVNELSGKLVKMRAAFYAQHPKLLPGGYSDARHVAFQIVDPQSWNPTALTVVVAPKQMADAILSWRVPFG